MKPRQGQNNYSAKRVHAINLQGEAEKEYGLNRHAEAAELLNQAIQTLEEIPSHARTFADFDRLETIYWDLSFEYEAMNKEQEAADAIVNAHRMLKTRALLNKDGSYGEDQHFSGVYHTQRGDYESKLGSQSKALKHYTKAIEVFERYKSYPDSYDADAKNSHARSIVKAARLSGDNMQDAYVRALEILGSEHASNDYLRKAYNTSLLEITNPHKQQDKKREREAAKPSSTAGTTFNKNPGAKKDAVINQQPNQFHMTLRSRK